MSFDRFLAVLCALPVLLPYTLHAAVEDMPIPGNIVVADANGDSDYESIASTTTLHVWWRNMNFLNQRWARRSIIEVDLASIPAGRTNPGRRNGSSSGSGFYRV